MARLEPDFLQDAAHVLEDLAGLSADVAFSRERPGHVDEAVGFHGGAEWEIGHRTWYDLATLSDHGSSERDQTEKQRITRSPHGVTSRKAETFSWFRRSLELEP